jgi:hypothetical protein
VKTYYWDFFGPNADGTAEHFVRHLNEFFAKNGILGCETDTMSAGVGHRAARCRAPEAAEPVIERALRPKRMESSEG